MIMSIDDLETFKPRALRWASNFDAVCYLDSNGFKDTYSKYDTLIAVGVKDELVADASNAFEQLETFRKKNPGWMTGFLGYDLKNEIESLTSSNTDHLNFPDLYFFVPQYLIIINADEVEIIADNP